jgi:hypothetical protein
LKNKPRKSEGRNSLCGIKEKAGRRKKKLKEDGGFSRFESRRKKLN